MAITKRFDLALINGKIITVNSTADIVQAVAVTDGRITGVGSTAGIRRVIN